MNKTLREEPLLSGDAGVINQAEPKPLQQSASAGTVAQQGDAPPDNSRENDRLHGPSIEGVHAIGFGDKGRRKSR